MGGAVLAGSAYTGTVAADSHLIEVSPASLELEPEETGTVDVEIQGPPFGRTDVEVSGVAADPDTFQLSGRGATQTVSVGPVTEDTGATFDASTPAGETQVVTVDVDFDEPDPLLGGTAADTEIPVVIFEADHSEDQFNALEAIDLTDPFTLAVEAPALATDESTEYAVTAYYEEFGESPNDRLAGPSVPLSFDEQGIASVTIGAAGTDADVSTGLAPGPISGDATLVNQIEVPARAERVAVETQ
ncbi:hypothetical protein QA600_13405 [Natronococcus sp. A-GB1]|uniref:hypothetical protein n=1 Tax=Natronococcus sp. A-GB1 TaxID=3037648 RepID=UPI00241E65B1|nr:hypothetical protein [Natronococcus sp. A-GB1]MDG5760334.1 hypothetical protein [Natronococcus sp. A-GB1]